MNGEWKEAHEKTVTLPETRPDLFAAYLGWLYTGQLDFKEESDIKYEKDIDRAKYRKILVNLIDAYAFGDYLQDYLLQNAVVDETLKARDGVKTGLGFDQFSYLWDHAAHNSTLMKLWVDFYAANHDPDAFDEAVPHLPHGFLVAIAKVGVRERTMNVASRLPSNRPKCYYHKHNGEADKCK